jgi:hypothetical protein
MPATFLVRAFRAKNGDPLKAFVSIGGTAWQGYTKDDGSYVTVTMSVSGRYNWYAKYGGKEIMSGSSEGGVLDIPVPV